MKYSLVNPFITGSVQTTSEAKTEMAAAKELYSRVSKHFTNNLPRFYFTIANENNKLFHFEVNEKKLGKEVNYSIKQAKMKAAGEKKVLEVIKKKELQQGGKKVLDDSSSDSSDSSSSSPYQVPLYVNPLRELLYIPTYYEIDLVDVVYDLEFPIISIPTGASYTFILP